MFTSFSITQYINLNDVNNSLNDMIYRLKIDKMTGDSNGQLFFHFPYKFRYAFIMIRFICNGNGYYLSTFAYSNYLTTNRINAIEKLSNIENVYLLNVSSNNNNPCILVTGDSFINAAITSLRILVIQAANYDD